MYLAGRFGGSQEGVDKLGEKRLDIYPVFRGEEDGANGRRSG